MTILHLPAPAKINRFLHILGQRQDGYHELQTIFQFIDLCDELCFTTRVDKKIILSNTIVEDITPENNLILRAARTLQLATNCDLGIEINFTKHIPIGGGLGGGSSDAATTLLALNHLWQLKLSKTELIDIGITLGADIPVFIYGHTAWAEGIGERLTSINLPETWIVLIAPPVKIATAEIFFDKALSRNTPPCKMSPSLAETGHNDCEPIVRKHYPEVERALNWLANYAPARLTGTGGCVFAVVNSQEQAQEIVEQTPKNYRGFAIKTLNCSPVHELLK